MKKTTLQSILEDLYALDPSFREHEKELTLLLSELIRNKPDVELDERFVRELRANLLRESTQETTVQSSISSFISQLFFMKKMLIPVGGLVAVLALGSVIYLNNPARLAFTDETTSLVALPQYTTLENGAFGDLGLGAAGAQNPTRSATQPGGGFGGDAAAIGMGSSESAKMIMPAMMYRYRYVGDQLPVPESALTVYRRVKGLSGGDSVLRSIQGVGKDLFNIGSLTNAQVQSLIINQNVQNGYMTTFDFADGRISVNPNNTWYGEVREYQPLTFGEVPADNVVIGLANSFLKNYGIDSSKYGAPVVDNRWREGYAAAEKEGQTPWVPDAVTVTYPVLVDGEMIYEIGGEPYGLRVNVDVRRSKVQSIWNLTSERYERSEYNTEQDTARILTVAENGGMYGGWYYDEKNTTELTLGTPSIVYIIQYRYDQAKNTSEELFVPAYRFPVTNAPTDQAYMSRYVDVPLVKNILDEYRAPEPMPNPDGPIRILPVEEPVSSELKKVE